MGQRRDRLAAFVLDGGGEARGGFVPQYRVVQRRRFLRIRQGVAVRIQRRAREVPDRPVTMGEWALVAAALVAVLAAMVAAFTAGAWALGKLDALRRHFA